MNRAYTTLISADELFEHLDDPDWVVFDCRHALTDPNYGPKAYTQGHVPGARFANVDKDLAAPPSAEGGRHPLPPWPDFINWLCAQGVGSGSQVVAYDDATGATASRLWWMLRALGHERAAVLDGGFLAWRRANHPVIADVPRPHPARFEGRPDRTRVIGLDELQRVYRSEAVRLIDARSAERFRGESEPVDPVAGHIPGARNRPYALNLREDNTFRPAAELKAELEALLGGVAPADAVHYCGSGVSACHNLLAQTRAGLPMGRLYVGSWSQWCADPERPQETGAGPAG